MAPAFSAGAVQAIKDYRAAAKSGEYERAVQEAVQAIELVNREFTPPHRYAMFVQDDIGKYLIYLNRASEALEYTERSVQILEQLGGNGRKYRSSMLFNHASAYAALGNYRNAIPIFEQVLELRSVDKKSVSYASVQKALAYALLEDKQPDDALSLLNSSRDIYIEKQGRQSRHVIDLSIAISKAYLFVDDVESARKALVPYSVNEASELTIKQRARIAMQLARCFIHDADLDSALEKLRDAQLMLAGTDANSELATISSLKGTIGVLQGNPLLASKSFSNAVALYSQVASSKHPSVLRPMHGLAIAKRYIGQLEQSSLLFEQVVDINSEQLGENHISVAQTMSEWAGALSELGQFERAVAVAEKARSIVFSTHGATQFDRGIATSSYAFALKRAGEFSRAADNFENALTLIEETRGRYSSDLPPGQMALAEIYIQLGELGAARRFIDAAHTIIDRNKSYTTDRLGRLQWLRASLSAESNDCLGVYRFGRLALEVASNYRSSAAESAMATQDSRSLTDRKLVEEIFELYALCDRRGFKVPAEDQLFGIQIPQLKSTSSAIAQTVNRLTSKDVGLQKLLKQRQDHLKALSAVESRTQRMLEKHGAASEYKQLVDKQRRLRDRVNGIDNQLKEKYPDVQGILRPEPVDTEILQANLSDKEAVFLQFTTSTETWLALICHDESYFRQSTLDRESLGSLVERVRSAMDGKPFEDGSFSRFDIDAAYQLYENTIGVFHEELSDIEHLNVVMDGALQRLPVGLLLTDLPKRHPSRITGFTRLPYLIRKLSLSSYPSMQSLVFLRQLSVDSPEGRSSFVGFGDPDFDELETGESNTQGINRGITSFEEYADVYTDMELLRKSTDRLEETAEELRSIAAILPKDETKLYLGAQATEAEVKNADLSRYSMVAFATHGLMADELSSVREPALILTPPIEPTPLDDGLLTASEVASLNLNADWVLLSACNTASARKDIGADSMSGLAQSFFYAGARSILVTHWYVNSLAAKTLVSETMNNYINSVEVGKAESLRKSMLSMIDGEYGATFSHPYFWAPFMLLGDGS